MNILLIGMNHKTAPLEIREKLCLSWEGGASPLGEIMKIPQVRESIYLSTCNRVEVLVHTADLQEAQRGLTSFVMHHGNLDSALLEKCLYRYVDEEAVRHLFRVTASLDSMVMGEPQILGQVKDAFRHSVEHRTTGVILNRVIHHAFRVAKRIRTETGIANNAVSVGYAAVELAKKIFGSLKDKTILLVGAGEMSELAARHLIKQGIGRILITNRTYTRALQMAQEFGGDAVAFAGLAEALQDVDIVISSTGACEPVITAEMVAAALRRRRNRLLFLIDIAVPRDIDPAAGDIDNVFLYNIDNLQDIVDGNLMVRRQEALKAEAIIVEEVGNYTAWFSSLEVVPTIVSLREKIEAIVRGEMEKSHAWMANLTEEEREQVSILTNAVVNKILHDPITGLKEESQEQGALPYIAAVRRLFKLDGQGG